MQYGKVLATWFLVYRTAKAKNGLHDVLDQISRRCWRCHCGNGSAPTKRAGQSERHVTSLSSDSSKFAVTHTDARQARRSSTLLASGSRRIRQRSGSSARRARVTRRSSTSISSRISVI